LLQLLRALRPRQWSKNLLVFVAPAAAGVLANWSVLFRTTFTFFVFCAAASSTYLLNDVLDREADRRHPKKRRRPIASGSVTVGAALTTSATLAALACVAATMVGSWQLGCIVGGYILTTVLYSWFLKREPVIELVVVASGFVLRAIAGSVVAHVAPSSWFLVVTSFGALFVVTGKRSAERATLGTDHAAHRPVLAEYSDSFLRSVLMLSATITITAYCLWTFDRSGLLSRSDIRPAWIRFSIVPVVTAVLHVLRRLDRGEGGEPEDLILHDRRLQLFGLVWVTLMCVGLYA
jgi:decaprenyl-phosphate phosphoribosyltransferase